MASIILQNRTRTRTSKRHTLTDRAHSMDHGCVTWSWTGLNMYLLSDHKSLSRILEDL